MACMDTVVKLVGTPAMMMTFLQHTVWIISLPLVFSFVFDGMSLLVCDYLHLQVSSSKTTKVRSTLTLTVSVLLQVLFPVILMVTSSFHCLLMLKLLF